MIDHRDRINDQEETTIAAISTAVSQSGIGIIRISGPQAIAVADRVFRFPGNTDRKTNRRTDKEKSSANERRLSDMSSHTIHYGYVYDGPEMVDEVLVSLFRAPRSYTAEDTVEINCHGGVYAMRRVLQTVLAAGAVPAEPGEFTRRAFLNGRLDLSAAEAVMDVIDSQSRFSLDNSLRQLKGSLRDAITALRGEILHETAAIESALDDPEHYSLEGYGDELSEKVAAWMSRTSKLRDSYYDGRILSEGIKTVILGRPNAGKSSLLNALLGEERAIVTDIPGTTRDTIRETISLGDISLQIMDTAGIRETADAVESIGIERALQAAEEADLCLVVIDSSEDISEDDLRILRETAGKRRICLLNKTDRPVRVTEADIHELLACQADGQSEKGKDKSKNKNSINTNNSDNNEDDTDSSIPILGIAASLGIGIDELKETIRDMFFSGNITLNEQVIITNERHKRKLDEACDFLSNVRQGLDAGLPEDFLTIDLMGAYVSFGEIIGEQVEEDLVEEIFSKFCMGK